MTKGAFQSVTWRSATLVLFETCLITVAVASAAYARLGDLAWPLLGNSDGLLRTLVIAFVCQFSMYYCHLYDDPRVRSDRRELLTRLFQALGSSSLILALLYYWFPSLMLGRGVFVIATVFVTLAVIAWRAVFSWLTSYVGPRERLLLVGTSQAAIDLARELHQRPDLGLEIVGFVDPDPNRVGLPIFNPGIIGVIDDIPTIVRDRDIDKVVVSLADARGRLPMNKLLEMRMRGVKFEHLATVYESYTGKIAIESLRPSWLIFSSGFSTTKWQQAIKRTMDVCLSIVGLVMAFPILVLLGIAIRLGSKGPALYHQDRVGLDNRVFSVHKLRSMRTDAESATGAVWASRGDTRVTSLGRFLRRTRLDELPQLWNVLRGDMSLVGPRPERPEFVGQLSEQIPFYGQRHSVKPGLTGWAQVRYTYGASVEDAMEKLQYDLYYIKNFSLSLDILILFETIRTVMASGGI